MPKRKRRVSRWEKEHDIPAYKRWFYKKFLLPDLLFLEETVKSMKEEYKKLKEEQEKALAKGDRKQAREYGRKAMMLSKKADFLYAQLKKGTDAVKAAYIADLTSLGMVNKGAGKVADEMLGVILQEEEGKISEAEATRRLLELNKKLFEALEEEKK